MLGEVFEKEEELVEVVVLGEFVVVEAVVEVVEVLVIKVVEAKVEVELVVVVLVVVVDVGIGVSSSYSPYSQMDGLVATFGRHETIIMDRIANFLFRIVFFFSFFLVLEKMKQRATIICDRGRGKSD